MANNEIREPVQKRSIEKKEKIIQAGFELICEKGYYNTNTAEIAKVAGVSTGIIYQYFNDKHDILIEGIKTYSNSIFFPMLVFSDKDINFDNFNVELKNMINKFINNHKVSKTAHEELMAMTHSDLEVANIFHDVEIEMTEKVSAILVKNGFDPINLSEKVHISINLIDDLCHEIIYHKHKQLNYEKMIDIVIEMISNILEKN